MAALSVQSAKGGRKSVQTGGVARLLQARAQARVGGDAATERDARRAPRLARSEASW